MLALARKARVLVVSLALLAAPALVRAEGLSPTSGERLLDEAIEVTRSGWYDAEGRDKIDWESLRSRYRERLRAAASALEAHHVLNELLGELKTSHLALMEGDVYARELDSEFKGEPTARAAIELEELEDGYFVGLVYEGSAAEKAGLRVGDQVVSIDGAPPSQTRLLEESGHDPGLPSPRGFVVKPKTGEKGPDELVLEVRHARGGPKETVRFTPSPISMLDSVKTSVRLVEKDGKKIGVIHLWHFMSPKINTILTKALKGELASADGLVLDVRGRGGRSDVMYQALTVFSGKSAAWKKPVVVLQDRGTRSAKEIFAWAWKDKGLGKIVGENSAGAVIGCTFKKLFDGSVLMHPVQDVKRLTRGENLEGKGVAPDVAVDPGELEFRNGKDPILDRGLEVLLERLKERASRRYL